MTFDPAPFAARRNKLADAMRAAGGGVAIVPTAPRAIRNGGSEYAYRYDSGFFYLSGFREPEAALVIIAGDTTQSLLFCREKNPELEVWEGFRYGPAAACEHFGFDAAYPIGELDARLPDLLADQATVFSAIGASEEQDQRIIRALDAIKARARSGITPPTAIRELRELLDEMRLFKDAFELETMRRAAAITCAAHRRAMRFARPGRFEYEVQAELEHEFMRSGAQAPAYTSIVAGGANACVLHYIENRAELRAGELLLIDAGCEVDGYAADITRSFPVGGRYSGPQRAIYELVLAAQAAAFAALRPGEPCSAFHDAAVGVLTRGLVDLGLLQGSVDGLIEAGGYKRFYMHNTGHWLGLDVHDAGRYRLAGQSRPLAAGQVITVEPGLYLRAAGDIPERFWNIGVRIEDDVLITPDGHEILTDAAPRSVADIEALTCS
ncbi:MAG: aminopeptidase P N-terminal domain-containing protein [Betaproteobacteria bacterium]|nr:aminopeptidase P N-terminal domain-containing protein [Betaproteobacteria bacterium]